MAASSAGEAEHPFDEPVLRSDVTLHPPNLSLLNLVHRRVALNRPPRTTELAKMLLGTDPFFGGAVILLQNVVQVLNRPMTAALSQDFFLLGFVNRCRITLGLVGINHPWVGMRGVCQRPGKQRLGGIGRTKRRPEEIDRRSRRICRSIEVEPATLDPHVRLIDTPGFVGGLQVRSGSFLQFRRTPLYPSPDRRVIELQAPLDQQFLVLTLRKGVSKIPADSIENDLGCKMPPFEAHRSPGFSHNPSNVTEDPRLLATHPVRASTRRI